jgi:hypothetical protein
MLGLGHSEMGFWLGVLFVSSLELRTWSNVPPDYQRGRREMIRSEQKLHKSHGATVWDAETKV